MNRFWIFTNHTIKGPYTKSELENLSDFGKDCLICREDELGWWKEAEKFKEFNFEKNHYSSFETPKEPDRQLLNSLLEKTIIENLKLKEKNFQKEQALKSKDREFKEILEKKEEQIVFLKTKIKELENAINKLKEVDGWEKLYLETKKKLTEKTTKLEYQISEKNEEIKKQITEKKELIKKYELEKKELILSKEEEIRNLKNKISELKNENYEMLVKLSEHKTTNDILNNKINDLKKIILQNEIEKSDQVKKFCEEIAEFKTKFEEEKKKKEDLEKKLETALSKIKEIENINHLKNKKETEIKEKLSEKISLLKRYIQKLTA
ncbi:MAG: hypothetical protein N2Z60_05490 [Elusimicrobiales bacterium]|nr:hypothetical protein [Elusimicrobiales bacterium]HOL63004.1 hypothetical protein [Elusimicrobiales bacterium]HPO95861.1 hypothetical protein [Elusimicrobiales bacterium]